MGARFRPAVPALVTALFVSTAAAAQEPEPFVPEVGRPGKDVVWVPTPPRLVELMLDLANVTPDDVLIDLGSGDGRLVIAAAKRGARAQGVEYSQKMVDLARRRADEAGLAERATFVQGDMYQADISNATVMGLFLLPGNLTRLLPRFLALAPGSRIVTNEYGFEGWQPDIRQRLPDCTETWCTALLWIVPSRVHGTWSTPDGPLTLDQRFQFFTGTLGGEPVVSGRLRGVDLTFSTGRAQYTGRVTGDIIEGTVTRNGTQSPWLARRTEGLAP